MQAWPGLITGLALLVGTGCVSIHPPVLAALPTDEEVEAVAPEEPPGTAQPRPRPPTVRPPKQEEKARLRWTIEGLLSLYEGPEGTFGEPTGMTDQMAWDILGDGEAAGVRVGGRYEINERNWIEGRWAWFGKWDDQEEQTGVFGFSTTGGNGNGTNGNGTNGSVLTGISTANTALFSWEGELHSVELNWWHAWQEIETATVLFVGGVRFLKYDERADATNWTMSFAPGGTPFVQGSAENTFIGGQIGIGATSRPRSGQIEVAGSVKGLFGVMFNDIEVSDQDFFSGGPHTGSIDDDEFVIGFEVDVAIRWWFGKRVAVSLGYNLLIIDEVVRAHDALDFSQSETGAVQPIRTTDELVVHAILFGIVLDF